MKRGMNDKTNTLDLRHSIARALGAGAAGICLFTPMLSHADAGPTDPDMSTPVQVKKVVKTVPPEKAVATVSKTKVEHTSPTTNMLTLLRNVPGFNVVSSGPANLVSTNSAFSLNGFGSSEIGTTFDGVPIINTVRGGVYGAGSDHALTPLTMGQIGSVEVYSGANTPRENSLDSLGGTVNFVPKQPSDKAGVDLMVGTGNYATTGYSSSYGVTGDTGAIAALDGLKAIASYTHTKTDSFQKNVFAKLNAYYLNVTQPFNQGLSKLAFILTHNDEKAQTPVTVPIALVEAYGRDFQYPRDAFWNRNQTHATHMIISLESYLNPYMAGGFKFFYNDSSNDRTEHVDPNINNSYMGYALPMHTQSAFALSGYGSNFNTYNAAEATALFGSPAAGTQYQRYVDHYYNVGGKGHLTFLLPSNTVTIGGMMFSAKNLTTTAWYGADPVPIIGGYNNAWLEHDGLDYAEGYIQDNISLLKGKVHIYPGVKYVHTQPSVTDIQGYYYAYSGSASKTYGFVEPSLGVTVSPVKTVELYANYGRTYKAPDESAFYSVIGYTPVPYPVVVKPEYVNSIDAGVRYSGAYGKASLSVFDRKFEDIFSEYYDNTTGITTEYNAGRADYKGFTIAAEKPLFHHLTLMGNYGYTDAKYTNNFTGANGTVSAGMPRPDVPTYTANLGLDYAEGAWFGEISGHFVGAQYIAYNTGATSTTQLPAYETVDLKGTYTWKLRSGVVKKIKVAAYIENLLDKKYYSYAYIQGTAGGSSNYELVQVGPPRFAGVTLTASF